MIPTSNDLNIGEWIDVSKSYHKKAKEIYLELRLKNINKCVGKAYMSEYGGSVRALFSTENDGIAKKLPANFDKKKVHAEWEILMNELLQKIFH